ncbi:MAG: metal ABC transporter substrate-binding protein, partial [Nitrospirales bacterium]
KTPLTLPSPPRGRGAGEGDFLNSRMLKKASSFLLALVAVCCLLNLGMAGRPPVGQGGKLYVVASIPDLADITARIGGDLVEVESLARGVEDPHGVPIKPSFLPKLNRADLLVVMGMEHEHAWLDALVAEARNPRILPQGHGYVDCSVYITPKQIPVDISRSEGDLHPLGNPHYNLDPENGKLIARAVAESLVRAYPEGRPVFEANLQRFVAALDHRIQDWLRRAAPLRGVKFVSYHQDTIYFAERFGLIEIGQIELKPGIEPTQQHLIQLVRRMKAEHVRLVLREPQYSEKLPRRVAQETGARLVKFPIMVGGAPEIRAYEDLIEYNLQGMLSALQGQP